MCRLYLPRCPTRLPTPDPTEAGSLPPLAFPHLPPYPLPHFDPNDDAYTDPTTHRHAFTYLLHHADPRPACACPVLVPVGPVKPACPCQALPLPCVAQAERHYSYPTVPATPTPGTFPCYLPVGGRKKKKEEGEEGGEYAMYASSGGEGRGGRLPWGKGRGLLLPPATIGDPGLRKEAGPQDTHSACLPAIACPFYHLPDSAPCHSVSLVRTYRREEFLPVFTVPSYAYVSGRLPYERENSEEGRK